MNAIIFAAGLGTRLQPLTNDKPKALVELWGQPMLANVILKLKAAGAKQIVVNVHHFGEQIIDFLHSNRNFGMDIKISDERDYLLDTGGGIKKAAKLFTNDEPILVHNVDVVTDVDIKELYERHKSGDSLATLFVDARTTQRYLLFDRDLRLCGWTNVKTNETKSPYLNLQPNECRRLAFNGIHVVSKEIVNYMNDWHGRFSIIDFYISISDRLKISGYLAPEGTQWFDIGRPETLTFVNTLK
ncbi:MAG: nucleotidyltransferase family protein [Culturomica sp.]|jgi:NDP-sugar pyrophosphorylase family protein|nr:nucleotidyltransferase family protein [Culturomica sp.]